MNEPVIAQKKPYATELKANQTYMFCNCGKSANQPFCDGTHKGTGITPIKFSVEKDGTYYLCGCKHSNKKPFCDGTHKTL